MIRAWMAPALALICGVAACGPAAPPDPFRGEDRMAVDPVCSRRVDPARALQVRHAGAAFYFCSAECQDRFKADPAAFAPRP
jgi:YHS domain-containing protein